MEFTISKEIVLRVLQPTDAKQLYTVVNRNRSHLREWLPWLDRSTEIEHSSQFIDSVLKQLRAGKGFACGVFYLGDLVGMCGFHEVDKQNQSVVIGYWLSEDYQGKGIVTLCTRFFTSYAFEELGLETVLIPVAEGNVKSRAVCERLGFLIKGVQENAEDLYGNFVNHIQYAISKDDWSTLGQRKNAQR